MIARICGYRVRAEVIVRMQIGVQQLQQRPHARRVPTGRDRSSPDVVRARHYEFAERLFLPLRRTSQSGWQRTSKNASAQGVTSREVVSPPSFAGEGVRAYQLAVAIDLLTTY